MSNRKTTPTSLLSFSLYLNLSQLCKIWRLFFLAEYVCR